MNLEDILTYEINKKKLCYIINNKQFNTPSRYPDRTGTNIDFANLDQLFKKLNFTVKSRKNLKSGEIVEKLRKISKRDDLDDYSMFVCIILSYGDENVIHGTDKEKIDISNLLRIFKGDQCKGLGGKPKLFFIQACRVNLKNHGDYEVDNSDEPKLKRIPVEADFLVGISTVPGYLSWDNDADSGSWYIQALCRVLEEYGRTEDILHILLKVNAMVTENFQFAIGDQNRNNIVSIPTFTCMLRKKLYLV